MRTVRNNVFETNSSSCHSITVCGEYALRKLKAREVICAHNFDFHEYDSDVVKNVVPDRDFIPIDEAYEKYAEKEEDHVDFESFKKILYGEDSDFELKQYDLMNILEEAFDCQIYTGEGYNDPFDDSDLTYESPDIEGPIVVLNAEVQT